ncbi:MAG: hypothetical protein LUF84_05195 [Clostridiales bacterium]|nr:hypothetical protein [Clostridiales bacterium]
MKHDKLLDAIGQVDDDLVREAEEVKALAVPRASGHWKRWTALAAVAVLAVGLFWVRAWVDNAVSADTAGFVTAEDSASQEADEGDETQECAEAAEGDDTQESTEAADGEDTQEDAEAIEEVTPVESEGLPLLSVQGADGQTLTVEGETLQTAAEDALTEADGEDDIDAASDETAEDTDGLNSGDTEDRSGLPTVTYDPALGTLALTFSGEAPASVTAVCTSADGNGETALAVTDGVLTLPEGGGSWRVDVTVQWADGRTGLYCFWAEPLT